MVVRFIIRSSITKAVSIPDQGIVIKGSKYFENMRGVYLNHPNRATAGDELKRSADTVDFVTFNIAFDEFRAKGTEEFVQTYGSHRNITCIGKFRLVEVSTASRIGRQVHPCMIAVLI